VAFPQLVETGRPDPIAGVFETILVEHGRAIEVDAHLARLARSASALYSQRLPISVRRRAEELARTAGAGRMRIAASPGVTHLNAEVSIAPFTAERVSRRRPHVVEVESYRLRGGLGPHKWVDRRLACRADRQLSPAVPLFIDRTDDVLEASRANVFVQVDELLVTPPLDQRILPGVTRNRVISIAAACGIETKEAPITLEDLRADDEPMARFVAVLGGRSADR
jgi:para-aminobenzoate synthetase / 4-amino-4-deoxychorismate lyase